MRAYRSLTRAACALPGWAATVSATQEVPCPSR
jgi:hypothetical protein